MIMIDWNKATKEDVLLIDQIVQRFKKEMPDFVPPQTMSMDITACHVSAGCTLRLQELLDADLGDFLHDCFGINGHIDRATGEMMDCFLPRFSV